MTTDANCNSDESNNGDSLKYLSERIIAFRDARDWKQFHNPKDLMLSLVLEVAELLEHFQWKNEEEVTQHIKEYKTEISEEISDVLIYLLTLSHDLNIDVYKAVEDKLIKSGKKYPVDKAKGNHRKYTELGD